MSIKRPYCMKCDYCKRTDIQTAADTIYQSRVIAHALGWVTTINQLEDYCPYPDCQTYYRGRVLETHPPLDFPDPVPAKFTLLAFERVRGYSPGWSVVIPTIV